MVIYLTFLAEYLASLQVGSWISRVLTSSLTLDVILKDMLGNSQNLIIRGVENIKEGATIIRKAGVKMAGSEKAKLIKEASLLEAIA